jgi:hypothetical protein
MDVVVEPIDFDSFEGLLVSFLNDSAVPYHKHHRPVTQQHQQPQQPTNHPGTAKLTTENGRIILPKLNLNNNININGCNYCSRGPSQIKKSNQIND